MYWYTRPLEARLVVSAVSMRAMSQPPAPPATRALARLRAAGPARLAQIALVAASLVAIAVLTTRQPASPGVEVERRAAGPGIDEIRVQVGGAVRSPGVITAQPGERVSDAIARAGGVTADADTAAINLARRVVDQDQVIVPKAGQASRLLDVNRATQQQLEALPGIGTARATAILAARAQAPFATTDDLLDRRLVPASVYAQIRDLIAVAVGNR